MDILKLHIKNKNQVFLIYGKPEIFIRKIYPEILMNDNVILIASDMVFNFNSIYLSDRCISKKLTRLEEVTKQTVYFFRGL